MTTEDQSASNQNVILNNPAPLYYLPISPLETNQCVQNIQPINNNPVDGSTHVLIPINKGYLKSFIYGLAIIVSVYGLYKLYKNAMFNLEKSIELKYNLGNLESKVNNVESFLYSYSNYSPSNEYVRCFKYAESFVTKSEIGKKTYKA